MDATRGFATGRLGRVFFLRDQDAGTGAGERGAPPPAPPQFMDLQDWRKSPRSDVAVRKHVVTTKAEEGGELVLTMSTADVDRDRDVLNQAGWVLDNYLKNPVILWAHSYGNDGYPLFPIGRSKRIWVENGKALKIVPQFPSYDEYPLGNTAGKLFQAGYINAGSVGFLPLEYKFNEERGHYAIDFEKQELLENSLVPVPANPMALREAKSKGIRLEPVIEWAEQMLASMHGKGYWASQETLEKAIRAVVPAKAFSLPPEPPAPAAAPVPPAPPPAPAKAAPSIDPAQLAAEVAKSIGELSEDLLGLVAP
jgi:hypothetical protein